MHLLIVRHGPAEAAGAGGDAARPLSPDGRARVTRAAAALVRRVPRPQAVWTSPLVRARETAIVLAAAFAVDPPFATPLLAPGFDPRRLAGALAEAGTGPFALVGHAPDVARFTAWLIGADGSGGIRFGAGTTALVALEPTGAGELQALYPLETFALAGRAG